MGFSNGSLQDDLSATDSLVVLFLQDPTITFSTQIVTFAYLSLYNDAYIHIQLHTCTLMLVKTTKVRVSIITRLFYECMLGYQGPITLICNCRSGMHSNCLIIMRLKVIPTIVLYFSPNHCSTISLSLSLSLSFLTYIYIYICICYRFILLYHLG